MDLSFGDRGHVRVRQAWTAAEVRTTVEELVEAFSHRLPPKDARIVLKPNLNNDLVALVGNSVDLRVLCSLIESLKNRGFHDLAVADGSNVGVHRRGIDAMQRLRVDRLRDRYDVETIDLNHDDGVPVVLHAGAHPRVARTVLDADFLISIPKIKTHAEAGLSCALKNWVGICAGQQKRHMHMDLARNIFAINEAVLPNLVLVDGLVGMEGNGPGDGQPFRFGHLVMSDDSFLNDLVVMRLVDMPWREVPYMQHAHDAGYIDDALDSRVQAEVPIIRSIEKAPARSRLAELSEAKSLHWLKLAVRPLVDRPEVSDAAYRLKIIQDVYDLDDDTVTGLSKDASRCGECTKCGDFCPTHLSSEEIGVKTEPQDCIQCLYCWWVCPEGAIELSGELGHLSRQVERYKSDVERL
ncbi:MAG: DUF362 domain-containing protein [Proteobacteria bacterium]|nr:DUF362 domain-containing protein [Pseudomonadota bacterium]MCP4921048.1 DUF362 domain-containing protein [Pseudomonadota bacterium]